MGIASGPGVAQHPSLSRYLGRLDAGMPCRERSPQVSADFVEDYCAKKQAWRLSRQTAGECKQSVVQQAAAAAI